MSLAERLVARQANRTKGMAAGLKEVGKKKPLSREAKEALIDQYEQGPLHAGGDVPPASIRAASEESSGHAPLKRRRPRAGDEGQPSRKRRGNRVSSSPSDASRQSAEPPKSSDVLLGLGHAPAAISEDIVFQPKWTVLTKHSFVSKPRGSVELLQEGVLPRDEWRLRSLDDNVLANTAAQYQVAAANCTGELIKRLEAQIGRNEKEWEDFKSMREELKAEKARADAAEARESLMVTRATLAEGKLTSATTELGSYEEKVKLLEEGLEASKGKVSELEGTVAGRDSKITELSGQLESIADNASDACLFSFSAGFKLGVAAGEGAEPDAGDLDYSTIAEILEGKVELDEQGAVVVRTPPQASLEPIDEQPEMEEEAGDEDVASPTA